MPGRPESTSSNREYANGNNPTLEALARPQENKNGIYPITPEMIALLSLPVNYAERNSQEQLIYNFALRVLYEKLRKVGVVEPDVDFVNFGRKSNEAGFRVGTVTGVDKIRHEIALTIGITTSNQFGGENKRQQIKDVDALIEKAEKECGYVNGAPPSEKLLNLRATRRAIERALNTEEKSEVITYQLHLPSLFTSNPLIDFDDPRVVRRKISNGSETTGTQSNLGHQASTGVAEVLGLGSKAAENGASTTSSPTLGTGGGLLNPSSGDVSNLPNSEFRPQASPQRTSAPVGISPRAVSQQETPEGYFTIPTRLSTHRLILTNGQHEKQDVNSASINPINPYIQKLKEALRRIFKQE